MPHLEISGVVLVYCNIVNNNYQQASRELYALVPNKLFGLLLGISLTKFKFLKIFNLELSYIEAWFTGQNSKQLEIEDKINLMLLFS